MRTDKLSRMKNMLRWRRLLPPPPWGLGDGSRNRQHYRQPRPLRPVQKPGNTKLQKPRRPTPTLHTVSSELKLEPEQTDESEAEAAVMLAVSARPLAMAAQPSPS